MKRLTIALVVIGAMLIAVPATAKKPPKPPTEPPPVFVCTFDDEGVLIDSEGQPIKLDRANSQIRCRLSAEPSDSFMFAISGDANVVSFPYIAVTDVYPNGGDICFREYVIGRVPNPGSGVFVFATFAMVGPLDNYEDLSDGDCGTFGDDGDKNAYALTFSIGNSKGGTVQLSMIPRS
jgi:hypothetical protein